MTSPPCQSFPYAAEGHPNCLHQRQKKQKMHKTAKESKRKQENKRNEEKDKKKKQLKKPPEPKPPLPTPNKTMIPYPTSPVAEQPTYPTGSHQIPVNCSGQGEEPVFGVPQSLSHENQKCLGQTGWLGRDGLE
jgi:hypothetical protein